MIIRKLVLTALLATTLALTLTASTHAAKNNGSQISARPGSKVSESSYNVKFTWIANYCNWADEIESTWTWHIKVERLRPAPAEMFELGTSDLMSGFETWQLPPGLYAHESVYECSSKLIGGNGDAIGAGADVTPDSAKPPKFIVGDCYFKVTYASGTSTVERAQPATIDNGQLSYPTESEPIQKGDYVLPGESVTIPSGGMLEVETPDGSVWTFRKGGIASFNGDQCKPTPQPLSLKLTAGAVWSAISGLAGKPSNEVRLEGLGFTGRRFTGRRPLSGRVSVKAPPAVFAVARPGKGSQFQFTVTGRSPNRVATLRVWKGLASLQSTSGGSRKQVRVGPGGVVRVREGKAATKLAGFNPKRVKWQG